MPKPGGTVARGYGAAHRKARAAIAPTVAAGQAACARCGQTIMPGAAWDLDHTPDRLMYLGPAHRRCNRRAGGIRGNQSPKRKGRRRPIVRTWGAW